MNRIVVVVFLIIEPHLFLLAQDSLVRTSDLRFINDVEQQYYQAALKNDASAYFGAFASLNNPDEAYIARWEQYLDDYLMEVGQKRPKKNEKFVKRVYSSVHDKFLRKYELNADFDQIFDKGWYNCVTACAIYGLAFQKLDIPFIVKETPTHVYLITYPEQEQILIETTDPIGGFKTFSPGFKENFVTQLASMKLIDDADLGTGINNIFDRYYFTQKNLGLKELIGIHYYNKGIALYNQKDYTKALAFFEKAYLLFESKQTSDMLFNSIIMVVSKASYNDWSEVEMLAKLPRFQGDYDIGRSEVLGEFNRFLSMHLVNRNDTAHVRKAYDLISQNTRNEEMQRDLDFLYNYERARMYYNRGNFKSALEFIEKAFEARPGNADAETLLISTYAKVFERSDDSQLALQKLEQLLDKHETLKGNNHLGAVWLNLYLIRMGEEFERRNVSRALEFRNKFESEAANHGNFRYNEYEVGRAYSKGVVYYFKKGQTTNARNLLNSGLKYAPDNSELRNRLYMLNRN